MTEDMRHYEIGFLIKSEDDRESVVRILKQHKADITNEGRLKNYDGSAKGVVDDKGNTLPLSRIRLSYPINKERFVYFGFIQFFCDPKILKSLDRELKINSHALRFIIISFDIIHEIQMSKSKYQIKFKAQNPKRKIVFLLLDFGFILKFGLWILGF